MDRFVALSVIGQLKKSHDAISITTMTAVPEWTKLGYNQQLHLDVTCMGQAAPIALGLALGRPDKIVIVIDGDGSLLSELGILAVIGQKQPPNLHHFVMCNGVYESTGGQPIAQLDWGVFGRVAGYAVKVGQIPAYLGFDGPNLYPLPIDREQALPWPTIDFGEEVQRLRTQLVKES